MTTNVNRKTGVAHVSILIILSTFFVDQGLSLPVKKYPSNMRPQSKTLSPYDPSKGPTERPTLPSFRLPWLNNSHDDFGKVQGRTFFLHTKNQSWLEILPDNTIRGNTCKTKYGLLESFSHNRTIVIRGKQTKLYLCMRPEGQLYVDRYFDETNCGFIETKRWEKQKTVDYTAYGHHKHSVPVTIRNKNKTHRYYFGINCNGKPIVVASENQRKKFKDYIRFIISLAPGMEPSDFNETCEKSKCPTTNPHSSGGMSVHKQRHKGRKRTYLKFCRNIRKRFFQASLKELRRFTKRDCWNVLRKKSKGRKNRKHRKRRHRRLSPDIKSTDPT